jgi:Flp pilus assembly protein TadD
MRHRLLIPLACFGALAFAGCSSGDAAKLKFLASGDRYVSENKYQEAIVEYRNAVQRDARFGEARLKLAQAYEHVGDGPNAFREYVRAADLLPGNDEAQLKAGSFLFLTGQFEDAKVRATKVLERSPNDVKARILLGNTLAGLKDVDAAVTEMERAASGEAGMAMARTNIGYLQLARGNKPEAERAFQQAITSDPKSIEARLALANF